MTTQQKYDPSRKAITALRNAQTKADKSMADGKPYRASRTLKAGMKTAEKWLDGSHSALKK